jgi:single-stranded-DNA-specific exonuclease
MPIKRWLLPPPIQSTSFAELFGHGPLLSMVLLNRAMHTPEEAQAFLTGGTRDQGAFLAMAQKPSIDRAITRIQRAIRDRETIVVYGDFDADGVTSTALMITVLRSLGAEALPYIPHRVDEGYGLNGEALARIRSRGAKLVITVDCGIRSLDEAQLARQYGLDLIITDHHSVGEQIPEALAVINPKLSDCTYTEPMLSGVGVAFRLAEALLQVNSHRRQNGTRPIEATDLLDLVAIGTVADLAPLDRQENRRLVTDGLAQLNAGGRPGLEILSKVASLPLGRLSARDIGFGIGPRINAAGRLDSAMRAYELLMTRDSGQAADLAQSLNELNHRRQVLTLAAQRMIEAQIVAEGSQDQPIIMAGSPDLKPGIVGLVAGRLTEAHGKPSVVMEFGERETRASCRSIPQFDITRALDECAELLVRHGGHAQAAGFTVVNDNLPELQDRLMNIARDWLTDQDLTPTIELDGDADVQHLDQNAIAELSLLEPTGHGNPQPQFAIFNMHVREARMVGKEGNALKLSIDRVGLPPLDAIGFRMGDSTIRAGDRIDAVVNLEINEYQGRQSPQLRLIDVVPAGESLVVRA